MNDIASYKTLVSTLYKKYKLASVTGKINLKILYILDIVYELLYDCPDCINNEYKSKLECLIIKLQHLDKEICINREFRDIYFNTGNRITFNNNILNNSPVKVINTAPIIGDPDPSEQQTGKPPVLCETEKQVTVGNSSKIPFYKDTLTSCFTDPNNYETGNIKNIKIISLPQFNPLTYQGLNVTVGQVIDTSVLNNTTNLFVYTSSVLNNVTDSFQYIVSTTSYPNIYSEEIVTMFIKVGNE